MSPTLASSTLPMLESAVVCAVFAAMFLFGNRIHPLRILALDRRTMISLGAGMSVAYVFVHLLPELHEVREDLARSLPFEPRFDGLAAYYVALVGFLLSYGLHRWQGAHEAKEGEKSEESPQFFGHFAYVMLTTYTFVLISEESGAKIFLYALALAAHFLTIDHMFRESAEAAYARNGRWLLAGACLLGWGVAQFLPPPLAVASLLSALIAGAVTMTSAISELPSEREGRFLPFMVGGLVYGALLFPLA